VIIADTGFWLALADSDDRYHELARAALERLSERLITTWPVLTETCHLLAAHLGSDVAARFIESAARGAFDVFELEAAHLPRVAVLVRKYADLPMDLADASLVVLAETLGTGRILSTDARDFRTYRWKSRKPFQNLLRL
jgi:uncharacterized protein